MKKLREWTVRFGGLFNKTRKDQELDEEIYGNHRVALLSYELWQRRRPARLNPTTALRTE